ncbi:MAG: hypothetical protein LPK13_11340 [Marinobacter sp.]|nr:hypothetical protein [Marinobacter sp.]MDX5473116.1 hypothetical protein [Marinobacter sp.]
MKRGFKGILLALAFTPVLASAEGFNYTYAEAGLGMLDSDNQSLIGPDFRFSVGVNEQIFAFGGYRAYSDDIDYNNWHLGGAYRHGLNDQTDVWVGVSLEFQESEVDIPFVGTRSSDDTAPALRAGLRYQLNSDVELGAKTRIVTGDFDYFAIGGYGRYKLTDTVSLKGELDIQDGDIGLFAGATWYF